MHRDIAVFSSSLEPNGNSMELSEGLSCKNCGHWICLEPPPVKMRPIEKEPRVFIEKKPYFNEFGIAIKKKKPYKKKATAIIEAFIRQNLFYVQFLKYRNVTWLEVGYRLGFHGKTIQRYVETFEKERSLRGTNEQLS